MKVGKQRLPGPLQRKGPRSRVGAGGSRGGWEVEEKVQKDPVRTQPKTVSKRRDSWRDGGSREGRGRVRTSLVGGKEEWEVGSGWS